jgi:hypothetical protein
MSANNMVNLIKEGITEGTVQLIRRPYIWGQNYRGRKLESLKEELRKEFSNTYDIS